MLRFAKWKRLRVLLMGEVKETVRLRSPAGLCFSIVFYIYLDSELVRQTILIERR